MGQPNPSEANISTDLVYAPFEERYHYIACTIRRLFSLRALNPPDTRYMQDFHQRAVTFLTCLVNPRDERFTYELRIVSQPDPEVYNRGTVTVALLCRLEGLPSSESRRRAKELSTFAESCFSEYEVGLEFSERICWLLSPFPVSQVIGIGRRCSNEALDTLTTGDRLRKRLGFGETTDVPRESSAGGETILHIFPFIPRPVPLTHSLDCCSCKVPPSHLVAGFARHLSNLSRKDS